ncbi:MAG TPA: entericidin A/B family lipoprotein [Parasulfuritortus sp.]
MTPKKLIILGVVKLVLIAVAAGVVYSMYGCNTMHGVGQDVSQAGQSMQKSDSSTVRAVGQDVQKAGESIQQKASEQ